MKKNNNTTQQLTDAQRQLIVSNMPFAENMAKRFAGLGSTKGISFSELLSDAYLGLCEAALRYKASQSSSETEGIASFKTYAFNWCRKFIMLDINDQWFDYDKSIEQLDMTDDSEELEAKAGKVEKLLELLTDKEREVISLVYGLDGAPMDFHEIALMMRLHPRRVHQIYEQAMTKMELNN